jgi:hypothetical protein
VGVLEEPSAGLLWTALQPACELDPHFARDVDKATGRQRLDAGTLAEHECFIDPQSISLNVIVAEGKQLLGPQAQLNAHANNQVISPLKNG